MLMGKLVSFWVFVYGVYEKDWKLFLYYKYYGRKNNYLF